MKYKVGDKVRIKSLDWYNVQCMDDNYLVIDIMNRDWCGYEMTIIEADENIYHMKEDSGSNYWTDEMFEGLVEESVLSAPNITEGVFIHEKDMKRTTEYILPDGYIFKDEEGNVINATKIVLEKKKKEYPKTFRECQRFLVEDVPPMEEPVSKTHRRKQVHLLEVLLTCRDAYWKIAGEEMGLGISWKPDWKSGSSIKFCITIYDNEILNDSTTHCNAVLTFPTEEMRDAFYENFKFEIENCKELL